MRHAGGAQPIASTRFTRPNFSCSKDIVSQRETTQGKAATPGRPGAFTRMRAHEDADVMALRDRLPFSTAESRSRAGR